MAARSAVEGLPPLGTLLRCACLAAACWRACVAIADRPLRVGRLMDRCVCLFVCLFARLHRALLLGHFIVERLPQRLLVPSRMRRWIGSRAMQRASLPSVGGTSRSPIDCSGWPYPLSPQDACVCVLASERARVYVRAHARMALKGAQSMLGRNIRHQVQMEASATDSRKYVMKNTYLRT